VLNVNCLDWFRPFLYQVTTGDQQFAQQFSWKIAKILTILVDLSKG